MTGAMYAAISGLKAHMSKLNVIGNNIANVNTQGYKAQRTVFADSLYTTSTTGSNGTDTVGGRNPSQYGYGVNLSAIDIDMSTASYTPTGNSLDSMIIGQGFYMVGSKDIAATIDPSDPETLKALTLTRVGNFEFKADGYLSKNDGEVVYGFQCIGVDTKDGSPTQGEPVFSDQLVPIRLPKIEKVTVTENGKTIDKFVIRYPMATNGENGAVTNVDKGLDNANKDKELAFINPDSVTIDPNTGRITCSVEETGEFITIGVLALANVTNPNGVTHMNGAYFKAGDGAGNMSVALMGGLGEEMVIGTNNGTTLTPNTKKGIEFVNGSQLAAGENASENMRVGKSGSVLMTSGLESSKTDLATEFSEMITTQRGYQANTRIITVTDSMLEELVNMKR